MLKKFIKPVHAHCDIPCGIYETDTLKHAADTCHRMVEMIEELGELDSVEKYNSFVRMVVIKERHAQIAKEQLSILWGDYFKPEHLDKFPDLHETFWHAIKQASTVKHTASKEECNKLIEHSSKVADIFAKSKK